MFLAEPYHKITIGSQYLYKDYYGAESKRTAQQILHTQDDILLLFLETFYIT